MLDAIHARFEDDSLSSRLRYPFAQAELLRSMVDQKSGTWLIENAAALEEGFVAIGQTLRNRQLLLFPAS